MALLSMLSDLTGSGKFKIAAAKNRLYHSVSHTTNPDNSHSAGIHSMVLLSMQRTSQKHLKRFNIVNYYILTRLEIPAR